MSHFFYRAGLMALLVSGNLAFAVAAGEEWGVTGVGSKVATGAGFQAQRRVDMNRLPLPQVKRVTLPHLTSRQIREMAAKTAPKPRNGEISATPKQIGWAREVPEFGNLSNTRSQLVWQFGANGTQVAAVSVVSPGAAGIKLGIRVFSLPEKAVIRVYAPDDTEAFEFSGREILDLIAGNIAAGDTGEEAHVWWSPTVEAEEAVLEIILPEGVSPETVEIALPRISHLMASASTGWEMPDAIEEKAAELSCHTDVNCRADWGDISRATAYMEFVELGRVYICTGTLLNSANNSQIPYFLTANHCISTQTVASSLTTYWFHRSPYCNGAGYDSQRKSLAGGASLLYATASTDTSFLKLNRTPPEGVIFAGWQSSTPSKGMLVAGVHSPGGDRQKIAVGQMEDWSSGLNTAPATASDNYIKIRWGNGATEGGSSGSGVFDASSKRLIGTLYGGPEVHSCSGGFDIYGRFDRAYQNKLREFLDPGTSPPVVTPPTTTGNMLLRDAIYLYNLPVVTTGAKTLVGYGCDIFQLLLDVTSGYTDIALNESSVPNGNVSNYPDRIYSSARMFSYALYTSSPLKAFGLRSNGGGGAGQVGAVTAFGYCFSTNANAKVLLHDAVAGTCQLSDKRTVACSGGYPSSAP